MYDVFFGLSSRPFQAVVSTEGFVPLQPMTELLSELEQCVISGDGVAVLTGAAGTGKSTLCRQLAHKLEPRFHCVMLTTADFPTRRSLLQATLFELQRDYAGKSEQEVRLALLAAAKDFAEQGRRLLVIIDEGEHLSHRMFDELRGLTNHVHQGDSLIRIVVAGTMRLEEKLAEPEAHAFNQRVRLQLPLHRLTQQQSAQYLTSRLAQAGGEPEAIFAEEALRLICQAADGNCRCLNQLADHAMLLAADAEVQPVPARLVLEALHDLRQLPLHWNDSVATADEPCVVSETDSTQDSGFSEEADREGPSDEGTVTPDEPPTYASVEVGCNDFGTRDAVTSAPSTQATQERTSDDDVVAGREPDPPGATMHTHCDVQSTPQPVTDFNATEPRATEWEEFDLQDRYAHLDHLRERQRSRPSAPAPQPAKARSIRSEHAAHRPEHRSLHVIDKILPLIEDDGDLSDEAIDELAHALGVAPAGLTSPPPHIEEDLGREMIDLFMQTREAVRGSRQDDADLASFPREEPAEETSAPAQEAYDPNYDFDLIHPDAAPQTRADLCAEEHDVDEEAAAIDSAVVGDVSADAHDEEPSSVESSEEHLERQEQSASLAAAADEVEAPVGEVECLDESEMLEEESSDCSLARASEDVEPAPADDELSDSEERLVGDFSAEADMREMRSSSYDDQRPYSQLFSRLRRRRESAVSGR